MSRAGGPEQLGSALLYSQCWEDVDVARTALNIRPGDTVVAIAAAGDNVLALLQDDPRQVLAVDVNAAQSALLELKRAAVGNFADATALDAFLGAAPSSTRTAGYENIRPRLTPPALRYWDANLPMIEAGVIHTGRFERYVAHFRRAVLPFVPGRRAVRDMLVATDLEAQRRTYRERWNSRRWRMLFRVFFSQALLRRFGRDPAFFAHCEIDDVGAHYLARAEHALTNVPIRTNPYLTYMLSGRFGGGRQRPDYLRPEAQPVIRQRIDRIALETASLDAVLRALPSRSVGAFYLSDIFELSSAEDYATSLAEIARVGRVGARICYWNNLVRRGRPEALAGELDSHADEARSLHLRDRAFLYSRLVIESVRGGAA